jgi:hypothetical protein
LRTSTGDLMTRPSSEPYCKRRRLPPSSYSGKRTSTSPLMNELRTSSEERSLHQQHHDVTRTNNPTSVERRGLETKSTPPEHPPLAPEEHLTEANVHWTTSSMPSARTTRTCATPSGTTETSNTLLGTTDPSNLYCLPHLEEDPENLDSLNKQEGGGGGAFPRVDGEVNVIFGGHGSQESKRQQKLNDRQILVAAIGPPAPYRWSEHPITFTQADQWLNFDHPDKCSLLVDLVIRESRVKKVLVDGGSIINVTFPRTLQGLGVTLKELHESDTPFFGIMPTEGEYPLGHIYMSVTFGTPKNYRTEFLRFEVASFDCRYNAIIGRPGLAKFMAIPHYTYMILKMPGPQGIITVRTDFQGVAECFRVAIQATLTTKPSTTSSAQANSKPEEDLTVPANEAQAMTSMRPTEETKRINLGFTDERKTAIISSSLEDK